MAAQNLRIRRRACVGTDRLSQVSLLALVRDTGLPQEELLASMNFDEWEITSYDSTIREVCITLFNDSGNNYIVFNVAPPTINFSRVGDGF